MAKAVIEITDDGGKLQYAVSKSGNERIDKLLDVAIGTMNMFVKSGGNPQNLMGGLSGQAQSMLRSMLGGGGGNMFGGLFG
jgi:hypothetical protein